MKLDWKYAAVAAAVSAGVAFGAVACNDDKGAESENSASQQSVDELAARVQRNEMVMAVLAIGDLPFHEINMSINDGEIPADAIPSLRTLVRFTQLTEWNADLDGAATEVHDDALRLIDAIEANDIEQAKTLSTTVHEEYHQFTVDAWNVLAPATSGAENHGGSTPAAGGTPADHGAMTPAADGGGDMTPTMNDSGGGMPAAEVTP